MENRVGKNFLLISIFLLTLRHLPNSSHLYSLDKLKKKPKKKEIKKLNLSLLIYGRKEMQGETRKKAT